MKAASKDLAKAGAEPGGDPKLTPKQAAFVQEYLVDRNATQAAIRAGYSKKTAGVIGAQNLKKLNIAAELQKRSQVLTEKLEIDQEWCRCRLVAVVEYGLSEEEIIKETKVTRDDEEGITTVETVKLVRKRDVAEARKALEFLGRDAGMCGGDDDRQRQRPAFLIIQNL